MRGRVARRIDKHACYRRHFGIVDCGASKSEATTGSFPGFVEDQPARPRYWRAVVIVPMS